MSDNDVFPVTPKAWLEIDQVVQEASMRMVRVVRGEEVPDDGFNPADRIIAIMREALLSEFSRDGDDDTFLHTMRWEFAACSVVDNPDADEYAHDTVKHVEKVLSTTFGPASDGDQHEEGTPPRARLHWTRRCGRARQEIEDMSETLAEQARRKGFTQYTHRIGTEAYPLTVRPDPLLPKDWVVIDRWLAITKEHIIEIDDAVSAYAAARLTDQPD